MWVASAVVSVELESPRFSAREFTPLSDSSRSFPLRVVVPGVSSRLRTASTSVWYEASARLVRLSARRAFSMAAIFAASAARLASTASLRAFAIRIAAAVDPTATRASRPTMAAARADVRGLRRHHRQSLSDGEIGLERIGSPARNRRQSSASAAASAYRRSGSFWRHFRQIVSTSAGTWETSSEGRTGSSLTTSIVVSYGEAPRNGGRPTSIS